MDIRTQHHMLIIIAEEDLLMAEITMAIESITIPEIMFQVEIALTTETVPA
ncbi:hypothetical protein D3C72_2511940 [compost metagenome]